MPSSRCPYCKHPADGEPRPKCPSCGKIMLVPKMREPNPRLARQRVIENIWREAERKKAELHGAPALRRNPKLYFGIVLALAVVGLLLSRATDKALGRQAGRVTPELRTLRNLDVLAEALGRYRLHTGAYPDARHGGLGALVRDPGAEHAPRWNGPYVSHLCKDAWGEPFRYAPPEQEGYLPALSSSGPDRAPGTPDDLRPDPACFDPGTDWTNGWLRAHERLPGAVIL